VEIYGGFCRKTAKEQSNEFALGEVMGPGNGHFVVSDVAPFAYEYTLYTYQ
jgi:hypothetical protein